MLGTVASSSSSSVELPRRPHTACAGARALATVVVEAEDSDVESDGASLDPDDDEPDPQPAVRAQVPRPQTSAGYASAGYASHAYVKPGATLTSVQETKRPLTAPNEHTKVAETPVNEPTKANILVLNELPKDEKLLLGGLWGYASAGKAEDKLPRPSSGSSTARSVPKALPSSMAEKLPRRCVQLQSRPAMAPRAARLTSHNSWANHLPMRLNAPGAADCKKPGLRLRNRSGQASSPKRPTSAQKNAANQEAAAALEKSTHIPAVEVFKEPAEPQKRIGPKYRVLPGGSRALAASDKANRREFVVLEFRTEPRVVPASRQSLLRKDSSRAVDVAALASMSGKSPPAALGRSGKKGYAPAPRFRQDSSTWALEREALAAQAGC